MTSRSSTTIEEDEIVFLPEGFRFRAVHPGRVLAEEIASRGLSPHAFALKLHVPPNRISEIIAGRRGISAETALRLERFMQISADFWLRMQADYDLAKAKNEFGEKIEREVEAA